MMRVFRMLVLGHFFSDNLFFYVRWGSVVLQRHRRGVNGTEYAQFSVQQLTFPRNEARLAPSDMATGLLNQGGYSPNLNEIHDTLIEIAYKAGDIINGALPTTGATGSKKNSK